MPPRVIHGQVPVHGLVRRAPHNGYDLTQLNRPAAREILEGVSVTDGIELADKPASRTVAAGILSSSSRFGVSWDRRAGVPALTSA
jgi:hypothetical protein